MPQVWKEEIRVGEHTYLDETGQPKVLDATPEMIRYWHDQGTAMRAAGLSIPIPLEHNPEAKPMTATERAASRLLNNAGFVEGFKIEKVKDKDKDGKEIEVDALFANHDIADPKLAKKLPHTVRWVSPWISSFVDGAGRAWSGVITHSALTTRPRITKQLPFPDMGAALSLVANSKRDFDPMKLPVGKGVVLSRAGRLIGGKPAYPMAFSLWQGVKLAVEDLKKPPAAKTPEKKPGEEPPPKDGAKPPEKPAATAPAPAAPNPADPNAVLQPIEEALVDPDGDISVHDVLCDLLETVDIVLGEDTTAENFEERLYKAILEKMKADKAGADPMATDPTNPTLPAGPEPKVAPPPMYMSLTLEQIEKIPDPTLKSIAMSLHHQSATNEALRKHAFTEAGELRQKRLGIILPKLTAAAQAKLLERVKGAQFSLGADGTVKDDLAEVLDLLDGHVLSNIDLPALLTNPAAALAVMPHPKELGGGTSTDRIKEVVNEQMKNSGKKPIYEANGAK
jgi:hypothetical protein